MSDTKWLSEDEQTLLEEAITFDLRDVSLLLDRLAAERERNAELVRALVQIKTLASEPDSYGVFESEAVCESVVMVVDATLGKNGGTK